MADSLVLVTGATGIVGTAVLADLKGKPGIKLRALVRNPDKAATLVKEGYEAVLGDLEEPDTLPQGSTAWMSCSCLRPPPRSSPRWARTLSRRQGMQV
ncbi:MAG TPA: NAD(P)H-binding protein [Candidatus Dormibacteraeota bacterium]|nr:NAD(P)H-binding protein [Candidatus Dormibacteraeota bacterium]